MTPLGAERVPAVESSPAELRYGIVFLIILTLLVFEIATPDTGWARSIVVALAGGALIVAVATRAAVRRLTPRRRDCEQHRHFA